MKSSESVKSEKRESALSVAVYRRYLPGSCFATFGGWVVRFLLGWSAWNLTESALWVGVVAGLMLAPSILLSPVFGIVSDRINPQRGLAATTALQAVVAGIAGVVELSGAFALPWLLVMALLLGVITSAHTPIRLALVPLLVPRAVLPSAVGYSAIIFNTSRILAPAAAAWLITQTSVANTFFFAAFLMFAGLSFLLTIRGLPERKKRAPATLKEQFYDGMTYAKGHAGIKLVFAFALLNALFGRSLIELLPALSGQLLNGDATNLATLTAAAGAGSILGGVLMSRQRSDERKMLSLLTLSLAVGAVCVVPLAWIDGLVALSLMVLSISLVTTTIGTGTQILTQLLVEDGFRGRVLSLWTVVAMGGSALGVLVMGGLADWFGFDVLLPCLALLCMACVAILYRQRGLLLPFVDGPQQEAWR